MTHPDTKLIRSPTVPSNFQSLSTPIHHASTVVFPTFEAYEARSQTSEEGYCYGLTHTPTTLALSKAVAQWEGGHSAVLTPSGLSAVNLAMLSVLSTGDHVLIPANAYAPAISLAKGLLTRMGISHTIYDPLIGADIAKLITPKTRLVWVETPGSLSMEVADLPAIAQAAHAAGALVAVDNTWSSGAYLRVFELGADYSVQALTKYHSGHGDILMGAVIAKDHNLWEKAKITCGELGLGVGGDDAFMVLRGMQTMSLRLQHVEKTALELAHWLSTCPEVAWVLHPSLPTCPGHPVFKRDFKGSSGLFSFVLDAKFDANAVVAMMNNLKLLRMGASWGGTASLALFYRHMHGRVNILNGQIGGHLIRINVGLENLEDIRDDLKNALKVLTR